MITAKDLEAIEKIKAFIAEQGYTDIRVDLFESQRECAPVSLSFRQESAQRQEEAT
jgi:endo-1,4-beta-D-glucanase Y